jgi:NAD+ synthetase
MPVLDTQALIDDRVSAIRRVHEGTGIARAELDVSGGIDSATVLGLLSRALGPDKVTAVYSSIQSSESSRERAREAAKAFGVSLVELDLSEAFDLIISESRRGLERAGYDLTEIDARTAADGTILGSIRSCLRAPVGRGLNRMTGGGLRHGTGNECEDRWLRFFQKGGDGEVDSNPIAMLSKGEVYQLSRALGVPRLVVDALPSPDLQGSGDAHNDEDELKSASGGVEWTYSRIDFDSGDYVKVGTIELLSRLLDLDEEGLLFGEVDPFTADGGGSERLLELSARIFADYSRELRLGFLKSARRWEAITRHKMNPNCPSYGSRCCLLAAGILTNSMPTGFGDAGEER